MVNPAGLVLSAIMLAAGFTTATTAAPSKTSAGLSVPTEYAGLSSLLNSMENQILMLQSAAGDKSTATGSSAAPTSSGTTEPSSSSAPPSTSSSSGSLPPQASTAVTVGSNETMLVGELVGSKLNSSVIAALTNICGANGCDSSVGAASIPNINYGVAGAKSVQTGTLEMTISSSHYTGTAERDAMLSIIASSLMLTATGANCHNVSYQQGCTKRRSVGAERRAEQFAAELDERALSSGGGNGGGTQSCETHTVLTCTAANNIGVQIVDTANDNSLLGFMDFSASFAGSTVPFDCGSFIDSITAWLGPWSEAAKAVEYLGDVKAVCGVVAGAVSIV